MTSIPFTQARAQLSDMTKLAQPEPVIICQHHVPRAVLLSFEQFKALSQSGSGFADRLAAWRQTYLPDLDDVDTAFAELRPTDSGRDFTW